MKLLEPHRDVLALGRVRYVGQEVALVVADSPAAAQDAAEAIEVEYRDLPAVVDADDALAPGAPQLHDDIPGNVALRLRVRRRGQGRGRVRRAPRTSRASRSIARASSATRWSRRPASPPTTRRPRRYDLYAPTQGMTMMLGELGRDHRPAGARRSASTRATSAAASASARDAYPEYCALMLAAKTLGKPVKWVGSRSETFVSDHHGRAARLHRRARARPRRPLPRAPRCSGS